MLLDVTSDSVDTVGVWGSNPRAPTNSLNELRRRTKFSVAPNAPRAHCRTSTPAEVTHQVTRSVLSIHRLFYNVVDEYSVIR